MFRTAFGVLAFVVVAVSAASCGSSPPMPKGPPPEYEEHDAGIPIFEGDSPGPTGPKTPTTDAGPTSPKAPATDAGPRA